MLIVSDVHGAFDALRSAAQRKTTLLVLGDLVNLTDYRSGEGITADLLGPEFARRAAEARGAGDYQRMRELFRESVGDRIEEFRAAYEERVIEQYLETRAALEGGTGFVTYGNVDRPSLLREYLPEGFRFVDGEKVEIDGLTFGFVGGGTSTPLGAEGEVTDEDMTDKLAAMGPVDVLCSHLPPAVAPLHTDVVTGREERASQPILDFIRRHSPTHHFFGDVHQPKATTWRVGGTVCVNVGYFRATRRPVEFDPQALDPASRSA